MRRQWTRWSFAALVLSGAWWLLRVPEPHGLRASGSIIPQIGHAGGIRTFAIAPDGQTVATVGENMKFWDMQSGALLRTVALNETPWQPHDLRFSLDASTVAFLDDTPRGSRLHMINAATGRVSIIKAPLGYCRDFAFVDKERVCLNVNDKLMTYGVATGSLLAQATSRSGYPWGVVSQGTVLSGHDKEWSLINLQTGRSQNLERPMNLQAAAFSADGRTLATGQNRFPATLATSGDITIALSVIDTKEPRIERPVRPILTPEKSPDGTIALWDASQAKLRRVITAFPAQVGTFRSIALSNDGQLVAAYGNESYKNGYRAVVKLWDAATGQLKDQWPLSADGFLTTNLAIGGDGIVRMAGLKTDASGVAGSPRVWNSRDQKWQGGNCATASDEWRSLEWSPDGAFLAGSSQIGATSRALGGFPGYYYSMYSLSGAMPTFVFTGASGFSATTIRLWDLRAAKMRDGFWGPIVPPRSTTGQGISALQQGGLASVLGVCAFSPDGKLLAVDEGGTIVLRDMKSGVVVRTMTALPAALSNVGDWAQFRWSPQGDSLLALTKEDSQPAYKGLSLQSGTQGCTLTLWNTKNGKLQAVLSTKARDIKAEYSADGRSIVALVDDKWRGWNLGGMPVSIAALPALPRGTKKLCPEILTRQGEILRALKRGKEVFLEKRDILTGKLTRHQFPPPFNSKSFAPRQIFVAPDGSSVAIRQANDALALWNLSEWKLQGHVRVANENAPIAPAPGGRAIAVAGSEGMIEIYDPAALSAPLSLQVLPARQPQRGGHEWIVFSRDSFYHASPQATSHLEQLSNGQLMPFPS